jgi:hypothetical protein
MGKSITLAGRRVAWWCKIRTRSPIVGIWKPFLNEYESQEHKKVLWRSLLGQLLLDRARFWALPVLLVARLDSRSMSLRKQDCELLLRIQLFTPFISGEMGSPSMKAH